MLGLTLVQMQDGARGAAEEQRVRLVWFESGYHVLEQTALAHQVHSLKVAALAGDGYQRAWRKKQHVAAPDGALPVVYRETAVPDFTAMNEKMSA